MNYFPTKLKCGQLHSEFTLGTAQLGMAYGIANVTGMPNENEAIAIVREAINYGITSIDTARGYGCAEHRIGEILQNTPSSVCIITKLGSLETIDESSSEGEICAAVLKSIQDSCEALKVQTLDTVLLHKWSHYYQNNGLIWKQLLKLKQDGVIKSLGVSVYSPVDAMDALQNEEITHLQIPFNILDHRWLDDDYQKLLAKRDDVIIHVRSALLQGLLTNENVAWPNISNFDQQHFNKSFDCFVEEFGRISRVDLCYAYVRFFPWVTSIVVGVETRQQLLENSILFQRSPLNASEVHLIQAAFSHIPEKILNPSQWDLVR